ncbi:MAG: TIGR02449 family protein [Gammaproteobacteria bacterium]|nr:TIGR02449 family protein [Gammaproteobacteria bacterium]
MDIKDLETRIDELITLCEELEHKQSILESDKESWTLERARLLEKNEIAKSKIEAMIVRLKSLDQES